MNIDSINLKYFVLNSSDPLNPITEGTLSGLALDLKFSKFQEKMSTLIKAPSNSTMEISFQSHCIENSGLFFFFSFHLQETSLTTIFQLNFQKEEFESSIDWK